jgi:DNA-binding IclR family transcriptional regulator
MSSAFSTFLKGMNTMPSLNPSATTSARPAPAQGADAMAMILGALAPDRPVTLPALAGVVKVPVAQLFANLEKLEELRLVERRTAEQEVSFALTPSGVALRASTAA